MWITDEPALRPCPKCGWKGYVGKTHPTADYYWIACGHCDRQTKHYSFDRRDDESIRQARLAAIGEWNGEDASQI